MTVYNINLGIGWASSGVEYAQAYRANLLRKIGQPSKFVFMDMILADNIEHLTQNIGFKDEEIIWLYTHFTDVKIAPTTYTLSQVLASVEGQPSREERSGKVVRYFYEERNQFMTCYLKNEDSDAVERVEHVSGGILIRKDYFSYTRYCSEYFAPKDNSAHLYQRRFYNQDGSVAYDILMDDGSESVYRFPDRLLYGKPALVSYFLETLHLTDKDILILDRETEIGQSIFQGVKPAKLGVVVHAEHFSSNTVTDDYILWNNYYDYQFTNADKVDFFIVATDRQKEVLAQQFVTYTGHRPRIFTIPVGSLDQLQYPEGERKPYSMITASRLATEKHIDWLITAVVVAKKFLPDLTLDIYGKGGEETKLQNLIQEHEAESYIKLRGHADLSHIYQNYEVYLTASTSEGFGLTLMEAIGSGLPLIGFDVPYGNQTFIRESLNGYLLPLSSEQVVAQIAAQFAEKIVAVYQENDLKIMQEASYQRASEFLTSRVEQAWASLIEEVLR